MSRRRAHLAGEHRLRFNVINIVRVRDRLKYRLSTLLSTHLQC